MNRRTDVVDKSRQGEFGGSGPASEGVAGLNHEHRQISARQRDGGGQSVRSGTDDNGVVGGGHRAPWMQMRACVSGISS